MKIYLKLPGGEFEFEREPRPPMQQERFFALCWLCGFLGGFALLAVLAIVN